MNNVDCYRIRVCAAVLRARDELLVVRESRMATAVLNLPGGTPQLGETLEQAVVREVLEETGYRIATAEIAFVAERRSDKWSAPTIEMCFYAELGPGVRTDPTGGDGPQVAEWLPLDHPDVLRSLPHTEVFLARRRGRYIRIAFIADHAR